MTGAHAEPGGGRVGRADGHSDHGTVSRWHLGAVTRCGRARISRTLVAAGELLGPDHLHSDRIVTVGIAPVSVVAVAAHLEPLLSETPIVPPLPSSERRVARGSVAARL